MSELLQDLRFGWRVLWKAPGFTLVALATLAVGIGANSAIFSFANAVFLKPLPYPHPERIVQLMEQPAPGAHNPVSTLNYLDWESQSTSFESMGVQSRIASALTGVDDPIQLDAWGVSPRFMDVFGAKTSLGRNFGPGDFQPGNDHVIILGFNFWTSRYAADPHIIGKEIQVNGQPFTVVGVMARSRTFKAQIWRPLIFAPGDRTRDFHWLTVYGRLKEGVTIDQARAEMDAIGARIAHDYPASNKGWGVILDDLTATLIGQSLRQSLYVLLAAVGLVLLIACVNLANLTLTRGLGREREVAIRASLGASRGRLVRQFLTESVLLALMGGGLGVALGYGGMVGLKQLVPGYMLPPGAEVAIDGQVVLFAVALSLVTGVVSGLIPALQATRSDLMQPARQGQGASAGAARHRVRGLLIVIEVALAFMLLMGSGLVIRSFIALQKVDVGYDTSNLLVGYPPIALNRYPDPIKTITYFHQLQDAVHAVPGVRNVAISSALPLEGWGYGMPMQIVGRPVVDLANRPGCFFKMVSASYFKTLGMRLVRGRLLDEHDQAGAAPVLVINEAFKKEHFPDEDPIGRKILIQEIQYGKSSLGPEIPWEIVGVVSDEKVGALEDRNAVGVYVTIEQSPIPYVGMVVRGDLEVTALRKEIVNAIHRVNPDQTFVGVRTVDQVKAATMGDKRLRSTLLTLFGAVALLLSAIGIYGVISFSVAQRTREIGIRAALGASPGNILALVLRSGMGLVGLGLLVGFAASFALMRLLSSLLYGVEQHDPLTIAITTAILAGVAFIACAIPARRATAVNPVTALRAE